MIDIVLAGLKHCKRRISTSSLRHRAKASICELAHVISPFSLCTTLPPLEYDSGADCSGSPGVLVF